MGRTRDLNKILTKEYLIEQHQTLGKSACQIAREHNCASTNINSYFKKFEIENTTYKSKKVKITKKWLEEEYKTKTATEIAESINCSCQKILYYIHKFDIEIKSYKEDLTGQHFGNLIVLEFSHIHKKDKERRTYWKCECGCQYKTLKIISGHKLKSGNTRSCGKCEFFHNIPLTYWNKFKAGAIARDLIYSVSDDYLYNLFIMQNQKCKISGIDICFPKSSSNKDKANATASLDRIDNTKGYIEGNVQWTHKDINMLKNSWPDEEFINWCHLVSNHNKTELEYNG